MPETFSSRLIPVRVQTIWRWGHSRYRLVEASQSISIKKQMKCSSFWKAPVLAYWATHGYQLKKARLFIFPGAFGMEFRIATRNYCWFGSWRHRDWKGFFVR